MNNDLNKLRRRIDNLDKDLVKILNKRAELAKTIKKIKDSIGEADIFKPSREAQILRSLKKINKGPLLTQHLQSIYREIMSACLSLEKKLKVACLGPEMSYSHDALIKFFGSSSEASYAHNISDVFRQVDNDVADYGIVPIENSTQGSVKETVENLVTTNLLINGEINLKVSHCLMSLSKNKKSIMKVYAHEQSFQQCEKWLMKYLPNAKLISVTSNSAAVKKVRNIKNAAAIGSVNSSIYYEIPIINKNINDSSQNSTRFIIISKAEPEISGDDKTSLLISLENKVGALAKIIEPLSKNKISMSKIESIPTKKNNWEYMFLIDIEGHMSDIKIHKTLLEIERKSQFFRNLGSYPKSI